MGYANKIIFKGQRPTVLSLWKFQQKSLPTKDVQFFLLYKIIIPKGYFLFGKIWKIFHPHEKKKTSTTPTAI